MSNKAKFSINGISSSPPGYDAALSEELVLQLEDSTGVLHATYSVYDEEDTDSPLASKDAPSVQFPDGFSQLAEVSPFLTTITMPTDAPDSHSWTLRCDAVTAEGTHRFERIVALKNNKVRKQIPGEVTEYSSRGWSDAQNEFLSKVVPFDVVTQNTTDATPTNLGDGVKFPYGHNLIVMAVITAHGQDPTHTKMWFVEAGYNSDGFGNLTEVLAPSVSKTVDLSGGTFTPGAPTLAVVSNLLHNQVTGIAATEIRWVCRWDIFLISNQF